MLRIQSEAGWLHTVPHCTLSGYVGNRMLNDLGQMSTDLTPGTNKICGRVGGFLTHESRHKCCQASKVLLDSFLLLQTDYGGDPVDTKGDTRGTPPFPKASTERPDTVPQIMEGCKTWGGGEMQRWDCCLLILPSWQSQKATRESFFSQG